MVVTLIELVYLSQALSRGIEHRESFGSKENILIRAEEEKSI